MRLLTLHDDKRLSAKNTGKKDRLYALALIYILHQSFRGSYRYSKSYYCFFFSSGYVYNKLATLYLNGVYVTRYMLVPSPGAVAPPMQLFCWVFVVLRTSSPRVTLCVIIFVVIGKTFKLHQ